MADTLPIEMTGNKVLADGRVIHRPYHGGDSVLLSADEYATIRKLRTTELLISCFLGVPVFITLIMTLQGAARVSTLVIVSLAYVLVSWPLYLFFKQRHLAIVRRATVSAEQLPRYSVPRALSYLAAHLSQSEGFYKHGIRLSGLSFIVSSIMLIGWAFGADVETKPNAPPMWGYALIAIISGPILYWLVKNRKRKKNEARS